MQQPQGTSTQARLVPIIALIVLLILFIGLFLANYIAALAILAGVALATVLYAVLRTARRRNLAVLAGVAVVIAALALLGAALNRSNTGFPNMMTATVRTYNLSLRPAASGFSASEEALVGLEELVLPSAPTPKPVTIKQTRTIAAAGRGWLLREVTFTPLFETEVTLPDGSKVAPLFLTDFDARLTVRVQDMPKGSFYAARHADNVVFDPYLDTETVTWSITNVNEDVAFAYIPSPWQNIRPLITPFLTASSLSQWLLGLVSMVGGSLFGMVIQPVLKSAAENHILPWLQKWLKKPEKPQPGA